MRIAVAYDAAANDGGCAAADVAGVREAVEAVVVALGRLGHAAFPVSAGRPIERFLARLHAVDLVFNLVEGLDGRAEAEARVAAAIELSGKPLTGSPSDVLALCRRKDRVNAALRSADVAVPDWTVVRGGTEAPDWHRFPAIVKPAGEDGSVGVDEASVVEDALELDWALARSTGEMLVQAFVPGRELNVAMVGEVVLPVAEIEFAGAHRVVGYAAKWQPGSDADLSTTPVCPAPIPEPLRAEVVELARRAWEVVGGVGYGRVDLRTDADGRPFVLEVNPNPDLAPDAGLARMARTTGWDYTMLVDRIVREALR